MEAIIYVCQKKGDMSKAKVESTVENFLDNGGVYKPAKDGQDGVRVL
ncbi:hypothetical protein [Halobacterium jilantaiense]|uniref:Uncharacterized protein n=1 Tax=Halobacterium jilantaiense TaxID=355548 RepID=A0A1I0MK53_9EURY|nr:hypothetical protein [Halobacterium jilantaiense]SEV88206.1 hypothetical protein SAMN04487945_0103 [Halobacterium jilantaiense]